MATTTNLHAANQRRVHVVVKMNPYEHGLLQQLAEQQHLKQAEVLRQLLRAAAAAREQSAA